MAADPKSPTPESPTTARPLEMDDDDVQETSIAPEETPASKTGTSAANSTTSGDAAATTTTSTGATGAAGAADASATEASSESAAPAPASDEPAPPKPPRPVTEQQKNEQTLKEAFPAVDLAVIKAVLTASRGNIEAAFHALLEMTDPEAAKQEEEPAPPPQPPRPVQRDPVPPSSGRLSPYSQMMADEEYARQLAQHYEAEDGGYEARTSSRGGGRGGYQRGGETGLKPNEMWGDKEHSFLDDDLPVIQENLRKGFAETQTKFNSWFTGIKKKINEEWNAGENDDDEHQQRGPGGPSRGQSSTSYARFGSRQPPRRSGDYDADPELLSDDFGGIQLHGDGTPVRQNPNVFRPPPSSTSPRPGSERKVAFSDRDETIDMYSASPKLPPKDGPNRSASPATGGGAGGAKASKWQPMSSVDPTPMADNDPFSLGDSEDEKDNNTSTSATTTTKSGGKTDSAAADKTDKTDNAKSSTSSTSPEDAERLRKAAAEAMADSLVEDKK